MLRCLGAEQERNTDDSFAADEGGLVRRAVFHYAIQRYYRGSRKINVDQLAFHFVKDIAKSQRHQFETRLQALASGLEQRGEKMVPFEIVELVHGYLHWLIELRRHKRHGDARPALVVSAKHGFSCRTKRY